MYTIRVTTTAMLALALTAPLAAQRPEERPPEPSPAPQVEIVPAPVPRERPRALVAPLAPDAPTPLVHVVPPAHVLPVGPGFFYQDAFAHADSSGRTYQQARTAIEQSRYDRALTLLEQVIAANGTQADAAMYWKAYSQARVGRRADALATIAQLQKQFPKSRWLNDARALDVEIRQASGQAVSADALANEELKLLALRGLMRNDAEAALPTIEGILTGTSSPRVKDQALFVLSQHRTPRTRAIVLGVAKGNANPELQLKAIRYLGMMGGSEAAPVLEDIYRSTSDEDVRRTILRSYATAGARDRLLALAKSEPSVDLRAEAVQQLGAMRAATELADLYRTEKAPEVKRAIIHALGGERSAAVLVGLARAEQDQELKEAIVTRLSTMKSPEARDYLIELLK